MKRFQLLIVFIGLSACNLATSLPPSQPRRSAELLTQGELNPGKVVSKSVSSFALRSDDDQSDDALSIPAVSVPVHTGDINALVVVDDGKTVYSAGEDGTLKQSTFVPGSGGENGVVKIRTLFSGERQVLALALSHNQQLLAFARFSAVYIYDIAANKILHQLTKVDGRITALAFDPDDQSVAIGRSDGKAYIWDFSGDASDQNANDEARLEKYFGGTSPIVSVNFHSSGRALFVAEQTGSIDVWRILRTERQMGLRDDDALADLKQNGTKHTTAQIPSGRLEDLWISPTSDEFVATTSDGKIYRFKTRGLKFTGQGDLTKDPLFAVSGAGGRLLAVTGREPRLRIVCLGDDGNIQSLGRSGLFSGSITKLTSSGDHAVLWGAQKTGNLVKFDIGRLKQSSNIIHKNQNC